MANFGSFTGNKPNFCGGFIGTFIDGAALVDPLWVIAGVDPVLDMRFYENNINNAVTGIAFPAGDFLRTTTATYVDENGLIKTAVINNILYSEQFNTWTASLSTVSPNVEVAPNGKTTADKLVATNVFSTSSNRIYRSVGGNSNTLSVYAKKAEADEILIRSSNGNDANQYITFSLNDGTVQSIVGSGYSSYGSESIGDGWWRFWVVSNTTYALAYFAVAGASCANGNGIYIWGAQGENSSAVTPYIKTENTVNSAPRFDYERLVNKSQGLLIENTSTNNIPYSENFGATGWVSGSTNLTPNATTSPDGNITATELQSITADITFTASNRIYYSGTISNSMKSIFVKAGTHDQVALRWAGNNSQGVIYNLTAGTATPFGGATPVHYNMEQYANGWWRISLETNDILVFSVYNAIGSVYIWGAQDESVVHSQKTSYIPTNGATVTRILDRYWFLGTDFTSFYNNSQFSVYVEAHSNQPSTSTGNFTTYGFTATSGIPRTSSLWFDGTRSIHLVQFSGLIWSGNLFDGLTHKHAINFENGVDQNGSRDGAAVVSGALSTVYTGIDRLTIGYGWGYSGSLFGGHIKRLIYWDQKLPNSKLPLLSA